MKAYLQPILVAVTLSALPAVAQKTKEYDLAATTYKNEQVRGPRTIKAINLNVLRYDYAWNSEVTFVAGPDFWKSLTQSALPSDAQSAKSPSIPAAPAAAKALFSLSLGAQPDCLKDPNLQKLSSETILEYCDAKNLNEQVSGFVMSVSQENQELLAEYGRAVNDRRSLQALTIKANAAIAQISLAGANLRNFLQNSSRPAAEIMIGINTLLRDEDVDKSCTNEPDECLFMRGVKATWPSDEITSLTRQVNSLRVEIDKRKAEFHLFATESSSSIGLLKDRIQTATTSLQEAVKAEKKRKLPDHLLQQLNQMIGSLQNGLKRLEDAKADLVTDAANLDLAATETDHTTAALAEISDTSTKYISFRDAREDLRGWEQRMSMLRSAKSDPKSPDPFSSSAYGTCDFAFSQTKKTAFTLSRTDRMPGTKDTRPEAVLAVTVEYTSPFSISAGVAFSSIQEREFAIVPSSDGRNPPGVVNKFESTAKSSFHPLPLAMVHARLWEPSEKVAVHASFGMAGNFRSQNSGGSDVEFVVGPSVSLFRTMFLTPGLHIGHKVSLGGGFNEGDVVPPSITQPPLQKSYKLGFGLAITFTKP